MKWNVVLGTELSCAIMKIDLSSEFESFRQIDFDSEMDRLDYVRQKMLEAAKQVPFLIVEWVEERYQEVLGDWDQDLITEELLRAEMVAAFTAAMAADVRGKQMREMLKPRAKTLPGSA
jgi:hypothetical protein